MTMMTEVKSHCGRKWHKYSFLTFLAESGNSKLFELYTCFFRQLLSPLLKQANLLQVVLPADDLAEYLIHSIQVRSNWPEKWEKIKSFIDCESFFLEQTLQTPT